MNINIAICDDEKIFGEMLYKNLQEINIKNISFKIDIFTSGREIIHKVQSGMIYHIVFMDIDLKDKSLGTDIGMIIKIMNPDTLLIYVSSYDIYYKKLVSAEPFAFLEKPVNADELTTTVNSALKRIHYLYCSYLYKYKTNGYTNTINLKDVMYFESRHRVIIIHMKNQTSFTFYGKLDVVEQEVLDIYPFFLRASKSFFININFVKRFQMSEVCLLDDTIIKITYGYEKDFFSKFKDFVQ